MANKKKNSRKVPVEPEARLEGADPYEEVIAPKTPARKVRAETFHPRYGKIVVVVDRPEQVREALTQAVADRIREDKE